jgi:hypothetical protein
MGEAKRHAELRASMASYCVPISRSRFNLFAIGTRRAGVQLIFEELSWWASPDGRLIAVVGRDLVDNDFSWALLARDGIGRFRFVKGHCDYKRLSQAEAALWKVMSDTLQTEDIITLGRQGDETNAPIDLLQVPVDRDPATLHPYFKILLDHAARAPARAVVREIGRWLAPQDPHLVQEFQTSGFDQRLWEIYLWAAFHEFGLDVDQLEAPDFRCRAPGVDFTVEATTAAPSTMGPLASHPNPQTEKEIAEFLSGYMPMKFGSALRTKLNKKNAGGLHYWEREESKDKPFLLAIADFHKAADKNELGSMTYTQSALWRYLYGRRVDWEFVDDKLVITPTKINTHRYGEKEIQSGFFEDPLAANVSAVLFSNAGTLSKFTRMGIVAGFAPPGVKYFRSGFKGDSDPNAVIGKRFVSDVTAPGYKEYWTDEIQVFHNPNAKHRLKFDALPGASHHYLDGDTLKSLVPEDAILSSFTMIMQPAVGSAE